MSFLQIGRRPLPASFFPEKNGQQRMSARPVEPTRCPRHRRRSWRIAVPPLGAHRETFRSPSRVLDVERDGHCCDSTARWTSRDDRTPSGLSSGIVRFGLLSARICRPGSGSSRGSGGSETGESAWIP